MEITKLSDLDAIDIKNKTLIEYLKFKKANMDSIVLFQIGDFFETFFEDAKTFSEATSALLSHRQFQGVGRIIEAGIPKKSLEAYVKLLLNKSYKVCVCTQFKTDDDIVYRLITRKYTNGTIIEDDFLDSGENNHILSLYYENGICYIAYADASTGQLYKTSGNTSVLKFEIEKISPSEVIIPQSQKELFAPYLEDCSVTYLSDKYFCSDLIENSIIDYCKENQKNYTSKFDKVIEYQLNSFLQMDEVTRRNLELTRTKRLLKKKGSIFWFLNTTKTCMGLRLLKKVINEPLLNIDEITKRQNAVEELIKNPELLKEIEEALDNFCDLSRLCAKISNSTILAKNLLQIANNSDFLYTIDLLCKKFKSPLLKIDSDNIESIKDFVSELKSAILDEPSCELHSGGLIKAGYNANLDYTKDKLAQTIKKLNAYVKKEAQRLNIEKMSLGLSNSIGYYVEVPLNKSNLISSAYFKKQTLSNCIRYSNDVIKSYEQEIFNYNFQINRLEYDLFCELRRHAVLFVDTIRSIAQEVARIDVIAVFARCASENKFIKPIFNKNKIYIKNGYHPSLIKLGNEIVKNDTNLDNHSAIILTGANMSGKSTYLKQNAIICLFSQIGAYVPADYAEITMIDKIFFRQGITDDIVNNNSSFMVEMNDLKFVIENSTEKSLILLDEPAKSTNEKEGGAIARAFVEYLVDEIKAKMIVVTHNAELTNIESNYTPRVVNYMMETSSNADGIIHLRKMRKGSVNSSYAIDTAVLADLPPKIIARAKEILTS